MMTHHNPDDEHRVQFTQYSLMDQEWTQPQWDVIHRDFIYGESLCLNGFFVWTVEVPNDFLDSPSMLAAYDINIWKSHIVLN